MEKGIESKERSGLEENTNPFVVVVDICIDDGSLMSGFPLYFKEEDIPQNAPCLTYSPIEIRSARFLQKEVEDLVRKVYEAGAEAEIKSFAIKENYKHIIPEDLKKSVRVAKHWNAKGRCFEVDTFYLKN